MFGRSDCGYVLVPIEVRYYCDAEIFSRFDYI